MTLLHFKTVAAKQAVVLLLNTSNLRNKLTLLKCYKIDNYQNTLRGDSKKSANLLGNECLATRLSSTTQGLVQPSPARTAFARINNRISSFEGGRSTRLVTKKK